jgi:phage terminase large subunit GpA-like protein
LRSYRLVHRGQRVDQQSNTVVGDPPLTVAFGLLWTALDSSLRSLGQVAAEHWRATRALALGDHGPMRSFVRDQLCQPYIEPEPEGEINQATLAKRSALSTVNKRNVPAWANFLTMAQDVQGDRHYWLTIAHGPDDRWAIIDWGYEHLVMVDGKPSEERAPTPADRRRVLDSVRDMANSGWQVEGGESRMYPVQCGVDGGYLPDEIAAWVQGEPSWKFLRGVGHDDLKYSSGGFEKTLPHAIRAMKVLQAVKPPGWRIFWWKIDGHHFRRAAHAALLRDADQPASGLVPRGLKNNESLLLHLSGEVWDEGKEGKAGYWREVRKRHDLLDCLVYGLALALLHRHAPDRRSSSEEETPPPPTTEGSWVAGDGNHANHMQGDSWI